jgi:hypothetical protein
VARVIWLRELMDWSYGGCPPLAWGSRSFLLGPSVMAHRAKLALSHLAGRERLRHEEHPHTPPWWLVFGERGSSGAASAAIDPVSARVDRAVVAASFRGKLAGAKLWLGG